MKNSEVKEADAYKTEVEIKICPCCNKLVYEKSKIPVFYETIDYSQFSKKTKNRARLGEKEIDRTEHKIRDK